MATGHCVLWAGAGIGSLAQRPGWAEILRGAAAQTDDALRETLRQQIDEGTLAPVLEVLAHAHGAALHAAIVGDGDAPKVDDAAGRLGKPTWAFGLATAHADVLAATWHRDDRDAAVVDAARASALDPGAGAFVLRLPAALDHTPATADAIVEEALRGHAVLLLGFSADDPQLSEVAHRLGASPSAQPRYAIVAGLDAIARAELEATAGVEVIDPGEASLAEVITALAEAADGAASGDEDAGAHAARAELLHRVAGLPGRADVAHAMACGRSGSAVAAAVEALGADDLAATDDATLLGAGAVLLAHGHADLAARCYTALEGREASAGLARAGLAWVSWANGEADACAEGLRAAAQLDPETALVPEGSTLRGVRAKAGAIVALAAEDGDGEHDVERISLHRPPSAAEREALGAAIDALAKLQAPALAGYGAVAFEARGARLRRTATPGAPLTKTLGQDPRGLEDALDVVRPLADALTAAHAQGISHGAVEPALVATAPGGARLRGWGLAALQRPTVLDAAQGHVAPERLAGAAPSPQADAYGLAALLYRLVTGRDASGGLVRASALQLDPRLDDLFAAGMHPDPDARLDVRSLIDQAQTIATTPAPQAVATAPSRPISVPTDPDDLDGWARLIEKRPTHKEAQDAIARLEAEARKTERWDRVAEVLTLRAKISEVQADRIALRRELVTTYETKLGAPGSAFRELQTLIEEVSVREQIELVAELRRLAEITGQWGPLADSLEIVAERATDVADQARLYSGLGRVFAERLGASDRAMAAYETAIGIEANASNLAAIAPLYRKAGKFPELAATLLNLADHEEGEARAQALRDAASVLHDQLGDVEGAFATLRAALEEEPEHAEAMLSAETFARELEDWDSLVDLLDKRASASLDDATVRELRTEAATLAAESLDDPDRAIDQLEKILARDASHEPSARRRVELLRGLAEQDVARRPAFIEALATLIEMVDRAAEKAALLAERAAQLDAEPEGKAEAAKCREQILELMGFEHAVVQEAAEALERWYRREQQHDALLAMLRRAGRSTDAETPRRVDAWSKVLALTKEAATPDEDGAIEALEALTELAPDDHRWRDELLERYLAREDFEKAGPLIRQQVYDEDIDPKRKAALLWRGGQLREQIGKAEGAVEAIEEAVQLDPSLYDAWLALRDLYRQREQPLKAIEAQVSAARAHPTRSEKVALTFDAATTYLDTLGQPNKGVALLQELVEIDPDHRKGTGMLVEHLVDQGDLEGAWPFAQTWVAQARAQVPDDKAVNLRALSIAGRCALAVDEADRAREYLEKARNFDATNLDVLRLLGEIDMKAERWADALKSYQSVVLGAADKLPPSELSQIYLKMADVRMGLKERPKAIQLIERALDIDSDQRAAVEKLIELAENAAERVKARLRLAQLLAHREDRLEGEAQEAVRSERVALMLEIAQQQLKELQSPAEAAATLEVLLASEPSDPGMLHQMLDIFTKAERWRDVTTVLDRLATVQDSDAVRAKYLYAGAAIFRDQLDNPVAYGKWIQRVLDADPSHPKAFKGYVDYLSKQGAWKDLAKLLRGRLKSLDKDAPITERIDLFNQLGEIYETKLDDPKTALAAYTQAVRFAPADSDNDPELRKRRVKIMGLALSLGDDEIDKAIAQGHALIAADPMEFDVYHRLVELYRRRKRSDRATQLARTLAFLKQANADEQALLDAAADSEAQIRSVMTKELWRKALYHPLQDPRMTELFSIVWPIVAAREGHTHAHHSVSRDQRAKLSMKSSDALARYLAYAAQIFDVPAPDYFPRADEPGGLRIDALCEGEGDERRVYPTVLAGRDTLRDESEAGLKFRAAGAISRVRPGQILASVLPSAASLRHVFYGASSLAGVEVPGDSTDEAGRLAEHLERFMTPAQIDQLGALAKKVLDKGEPDVKGWVQGVAYTSARAGFVLCDSLDSAARVLTQQGDEGMAVPFKDRIRDLVAYSVSVPYLKLRKELGLTR